MKIAYIIPGSGDAFYCENCRRDLPLVESLRRLGHDVTVLPLYMPVSCGAGTRGVNDKIYCGAISLSLRSAVPFFRRHLGIVSRLLDARPLLETLPRFSGLTRSQGLETLTLEMIRGKELFQEREFEDLVSFLREEKPDFIHLSNFLLAGIGIELRRRLPVRLTCALQDEDSWVEAMRDPYRLEAWNLMREQAKQFDLFLPVSRYYAGLMGRLLGIPDGKMRVVQPAFEPETGAAEPPVERPSGSPGTPGGSVGPVVPTIGFLSRTSKENGLDDLTTAYIRLRNGFPRLRLFIAGGKTSDDNAFLAEIKRRLKPFLRSGDVRFFPNPDATLRTEFFRNLSVLSVPKKLGSAFGMFILEALAEGVPVVQPASGAYPDIIERTGGGLLSEPDSIDSLTENLGRILSDPDLGRRLGAAGRENLLKHFSKSASASAFVSAFESVRRAGDIPEPAGNGGVRVSAVSIGSGQSSSVDREPSGDLLVLEDVRKTFLNADGSVYADVLKGISFSVGSGRTLAITGPSGCGKSTLLGICGLLVPPDSGFVWFRGRRTDSWTEREIDGYRNRNVGFVFQDHNLLPELTVLENVLLPSVAESDPTPGMRKLFKERAEHLLELMGISDLLNRFPGELSSGERQRLAIARSGLMNPDLILADEPTAALDRKNADVAAAYLRKLADSSGAAVILVTHDPLVARVMDTRYDLSEGILRERAHA